MNVRKTPDEAERLFLENQGLVGFFFQKYRHMVTFADYTPDDVLQEIRLSLWQAALEYDREKGAAFSTFAGHVIGNDLRRIRRYRSIPKRYAGNCTASLDAPATPDNPCPLADLLDSGEDVEGRCCAEVDLAAQRARLCPQAQQALDLRLQGYRQMEIAARIGCSQVQVSRYLKKAAAFAGIGGNGHDPSATRRAARYLSRCHATLTAPVGDSSGAAHPLNDNPPLVSHSERSEESPC